MKRRSAGRSGNRIPPIGDWLELIGFTPPSPALLEARPFADEEEYWDLVASLTCAREWRRIAEESATASTFGLRPFDSQLVMLPFPGGFAVPKQAPLGAKEGGVSIMSIMEWTRSHCKKLEGALAIRKAATAPVYPAPRILRLAALLDLSPFELDTLNYLVVKTLNPESITRASQWILWKDIRSLSRPDDSSFYRAFDSAGPIQRLELINVEKDRYYADIRMSVKVVKALRGLPLHTEDLILFHGSPIYLVLEAEPGFIGLGGLSDSGGKPERHDGQVQHMEGPHHSQALSKGETGGATISKKAPDMHTGAAGACGHDSNLETAPYTSDMDYLEDHLAWFVALSKTQKLESRFSSDSPDEAKKRAQAKVREQIIRGKIMIRLAATNASGGFEPRAEALARSHGLEPFEKHLLLLLSLRSGSVDISEIFSYTTIKKMINLFFDTIEQQILARRYFYRDARLVANGFITVRGEHRSEFLDQGIEIDCRMADYLLGLDAEATSVVEGSHLYTPKCSLAQVVLPKEVKDLVVRTVAGFPAFQAERRRCGIDDMIGYGGGIVLLFYGPSGTGKTLLANAIASHIGKRILLINFPSILGSGAILRAIFREAKLHDAILFFDECESIFQRREQNKEITELLSEIERYDGLIIMATNRPFDLDDAMHRRITLSVEFMQPDALQREEIWRAHIPQGLRLEGGIDMVQLAFQYELNGGLIKNAVLAAIALATARNPDLPALTHADFDEGARLQMRGNLRMRDFEDRVVPTSGLADVVLPAGLMEAVQELVGLEKARRTLVAEWGFAKQADDGMGATALFCGPSGTGKSLTAEAVAYELGRPVKRVNLAQVVSKWVGEGAKHIEAIFKEARSNDAVLVFDEADALFASRTSVSNSTDRHANLETAVLLKEMERFPGVVILTTNLQENIDPAFRRRIRFSLEFQMPSESARLALWKRHLPVRTPMAVDVNLEALAHLFKLSGAQIKNAVIKAASRAALRAGEARILTQEDLMGAAAEESGANGNNRVVGFGGATMADRGE